MYKIFKVISYGVEHNHIIQDRGNGEFTSFPADENNPNYQEYLEWVADGGVPEEADA